MAAEIPTAMRPMKRSAVDQSDASNAQEGRSASQQEGVRKPILVVAYYTIDTPYEKEVKNLRRSLTGLPLAAEIVGVPNSGSWQANTQYKAVFLRDMLARYGQNHRLLYVDADAVFRQYPSLLEDLHCDIALHFTRRNPLSGTIYLEQTPATEALMEEWIAANGTHPDRWDQVNLGAVIEESRKASGLRVVELPVEYTFIFDLARRKHPNARPVIEHFQASRRFKRMV